MSSDVRAAIQDLVDTFVVELEALVRRAALETVAEALGSGPLGAASPGGRAPKGLQSARGGSARGGRDGRAKASARGGPRAAATARDTGAPAEAGRVRRSTDEIEATADRIVAHVEQHQGARSEDIRAALGLPKNVWQLTVKRLVDGGRLATRGEKRSTVYFTKSAPRLGVVRRPGRGAPASPPAEETLVDEG